MEPGEYDVSVVVRDSAGLENDREEIFKVFITKEPEEEDMFSIDNMMLIITIIISIFIVLTGSFIFIYRRYSEPTLKTRRRNRYDLNFGQDYEDYHDYDSDDYEFDDEYDLEPDIADAIVINKPVVFKMERVSCPGCGKVFVSDSRSKEIKCPGCGLRGELEGPRTATSGMDSSNKTENTSQQVSSRSSQKFKCPSCDCMFKTTPGSKIVKCPECGITGRI
jgi:DNA-directed RNA polymerase subunit RPC12/RpoP